MPVQTDTLVNMWKENIGSLQSIRCNEVWNRIKGEVNKGRICYSVKTTFEIQKKPTKEARKNRLKAHLYFRHMLN